MFPVMFLSGMAVAPPIMDQTTLDQTTLDQTINASSLTLGTITNSPSDMTAWTGEESFLRTVPSSMTPPETRGPEFSSGLSSRTPAQSTSQQPAFSPALASNEPMLMAQVRGNSDGVNTRVTTDGNEFMIEGGTRGGNNLFHSFQSFGLTAEQIAIFQTRPNIENVLGRINGGDASVINGEIRLTGSDANLFLINPAGMIFGDNATLNVPASFTATTANGIGFGQDNWFSVVGDNAYEQLTDAPTSFGFTDTQPGSIINTGDLAVESGHGLSLVGGSVYSSGRLSAPNGQVLIQTVPETGIVQIKPEGTVLTLELQPLPDGTEGLPNASDHNSSSSIPSGNTSQSLAERLTGGAVDQATGITVDPDGTIRLDNTLLVNGDVVAYQVEAGTTTIAAEGNLYAGTITTDTPEGGRSIILTALRDIAIAPPHSSAEDSNNRDYEGNTAFIFSNGGNIVLYSLEGGIDTTNADLNSGFSSRSQGRFANGVDTNRGGNVALYSRGDIASGAITSQGGDISITSTGRVNFELNQNPIIPWFYDPPTVTLEDGGNISLQGPINSQASNGQIGGNVTLYGVRSVSTGAVTTGGGDLTVNSGILATPPGEKDTIDGCFFNCQWPLGEQIDTTSGPLNTANPDGTGGGNVTLHANGNVTTGAIASGGGEVTMLSANGHIDTTAQANTSGGNENVAFPTIDTASGNGTAGGAVTLNAQGNITTGTIASNGEAITITSNNTVTTTAGTLDSSQPGTPQGGEVFLGASRAIVTGDIVTDGGDVNFVVRRGDIQPEGVIDTRVIDTPESDTPESDTPGIPPETSLAAEAIASANPNPASDNGQAGVVQFSGPNLVTDPTLETFYDAVKDQVPGGLRPENVERTSGTNGPSFGDPPAPPTAPLALPDLQAAQLPQVEPDIEEPNIEKPDIEVPDVDEPDIDEPDVDEPDIDEPDVDEPDIDEPDIDEPDVDEPDIDEPDIDEPDVEVPDIDEPDIDEPDVGEPDIDEPDVGEPDIDEPDVDEPDIDEPDTEEPDVDEPETDEPETDEPDIEDPDIEDPGDLESNERSEQSQEAIEAEACSEELVTCLEEKLAIARQTGDLPDEQALLRQLGRSYYDQGDYIKAMDYYQERLTLASSPEITLDHTQALADLAGVYGTLGDYDEAIAYYQQGLTTVQSIRSLTPDGATMESDILNRLGMVHYAKRDYDQAVDFQQKSLVIARQLDDPARMGNSLSQLGLAYYAKANYGEAIAILRQSLTLAQQTGNATAMGMALENLGLAHYALADFNQAVDYHQQSLAIAQKEGDRHGEGRALTNLGDAQYHQGNVEGAVASLTAAIDIWESLRESLTDHDLLRVSIFETQETTYSTLQAVLAESHQFGKALEITERGRARAFVELLNQNRTQNRTHLSGEGGTRSATSRGSILHIDPSLMASTSPESALFNEADFSIAPDADVSAPNLDRIRHIAREQNATLVSYSVVKEADDHGGQRQLRPTEVYIWVVKPDGSTQFQRQSLDLLYQQDTTLADVVDLARCDNPRCRWSNESPIDGSDRVLYHSLHQLHQLLIEPIADHLPPETGSGAGAGAASEVVFIPDDELFLVPFAALQDASGRYLLETHTIRTTPSIQVLDLTHGRGAPEPTRTASSAIGTPLIVGNPTMPPLPPMVSSVGGVLPSLPGAEKEAMTIAALLGAKALVGDRATEEAVVEAITQAPIVHLATHGLLHDVDVSGMPGAIALAPGATSDGLLTAREIMDLDLMADLVVLSACDTGRGQITSDGVIGLSRSLMSSGVPSVMVSLWQVPDEATQALMTRFYHHLQDTNTRDKSQALRQAMLDTMAEYPDPMNWSAFTLMGQR